MASFTTLYSGSSGNCAVVRRGDKFLLIDMGKSCRATLTALKELGLSVMDCEGILITHEHSDHVKGLDVFLKKYTHIPLYGGAATLDMLESRGTIPPAVDSIAIQGMQSDIGGFRVTCFPTSHDVPCVGYRIEEPGGGVMSYASDLGTLTMPVHENLAGCDLVALESNHDLYSLRYGPYSPYLKNRIESPRGHLDNRECAAKLLELVQDGGKQFALLHLSKENNTPRLAMETVDKAFRMAGVVPGADVKIQVQERDNISGIMEF